MSNFSKKISAFVCDIDCNDKDEQSIIEFGISIMLSKLLNLVTEVIIGWLFSMLFEAIVFLIAFSFLRSYAGGFHASSSGKCYIFSSLTMVAALLIIKYVDNFFANCIFVLLGTSLCLIFAPVESKNKMLDILEKKFYRKKAMLILSLILIVLVLTNHLHIKMIFTTLSVVLLIESIMLVFGKIILIKI